MSLTTLNAFQQGGPVLDKLKQLWEGIRGKADDPSLGYIGASMLPGIGEATDLVEIGAGLQDRSPGRIGLGIAGLMLPFVGAAGLKKIGQRAAAKRLRPPDAPSPDWAKLNRRAEAELASEARALRKEQWLAGSAVKPRLLHGTTHTFDAFDPTKGSIDSHHGRSTYFTDSPTDAGKNYASLEGPDLTGRIEHEYEGVLGQLEELTGDNIDDLIINHPDRAVQLEEEAMRIARSRIVGPHGGATVPAHVRLRNPVDTRPGGTHFDWEWKPNLEDVDDFVEPEGALNDVMNAMWEVGDGSDGAKALIEKIQIHALDQGGISAEDFESIVRKFGGEGFEHLDEMGPGEYLRKVYQRAGYDGTIVDAHAQFGPLSQAEAIKRAQRRPGYREMKSPFQMMPYGRKGMEGVENTTHYAVFDPKNIRSPWADFDPAKWESTDLLAGIGGLASARYMSNAMREDQRN